MKNITTSLLLSIILFQHSFAQGLQQPRIPHGWHLMDNSTDGYFGISLNKAYDFLRGKTSKTVIVAVIDGGIDTSQQDLRSVLWTNSREIPGNGKDDDGNGFVDDIHGWNFLGGKDGRNVLKDSKEVDRTYFVLKEKYRTAMGSDTTTREFLLWQRAKKESDLARSRASANVQLLQSRVDQMEASDSIVRKALHKEMYTGLELESYVPKTEKEKNARLVLLGLVATFGKMNSLNSEFTTGIRKFYEGQRSIASPDAPLENTRADIVGDDESDINDRIYGNSNIEVDTALATVLHGTHVAGIIGGPRKNGIGIADNVRIMTIRIVPEGDEHDKDVAMAIRYAVDNGAQIINMSLGKPLSPEKQWVDDAVKYAESKDVLIVHAAGNDSRNIDSVNHYYPNADFDDNPSTRATNWITVGASGDLSLPEYNGLVAVFSNYGKAEVDVFAPGVQIYSTIPGNKYGVLDGTSMAAPVVSGLAALILSYYPELTAKQVKYVIEKSVSKTGLMKVGKPNSIDTLYLDELCRTGGIVNAFEAVKMASTIKGERITK